MSNRYSGGFLTASYFPLKTPDAPTIGTATAGNTTASVTFTAPANVGGGAITGFTVISSPQGLIGSGASSPITVSGLTNGTAYTFTVVATNAFGTGPASAASNSVTPILPYSQSYTTAGTYTFVAPVGFPQLNVIVIGAGGAGGMGGGGTAGGGGGGYAKSLNLSVTPSNSYAVVVGAGGNEGSPWYISTSGGASSFNASIIGNGGTGAGNDGSQKAGGTASGGNTLNLTGGYGGAASSSAQNGGNGPTGGGAGYFSSGQPATGGIANQTYGGNGGNNNTSTAGGVNGFNYGGGGGGGYGRANTTPSSNCIGAGGAVFIYYP